MADLHSIFAPIVGDEHVTVEDINPDYSHDESLGATAVTPAAVLTPANTDEVAQLLAAANQHGIAIVARGSGSGLSGGAIPPEGGVIVSFERMKAIIEIDTENHVAIVEPGVTLAELDAALAPLGLVYPVRPGADSASIGGTVATNAAGMRAIKYGVTRNHVLGLETVLPSGEVMLSGGKISKISQGYNLTQLVIGSEGTLGLVTKIWCKLTTRLTKSSTILAPFATLDEVTAAIPRIIETGVNPLVLEYIDLLTMAVIAEDNNLDVGIPQHIKDTALAYLVVQVEDQHESRVDEDAMRLGELLGELGAMDVYVLPAAAANDLITAREHAFYAAQSRGFQDIIDVVVPRSEMSPYMTRVQEIGAEHESLIVGCGHAGDGNVHMSVWQADADVRKKVMRALLEAGLALGGAISGEHGIGREKKAYLAELGDPVQMHLMKGIKRTFDPNGILNPGAIFDLD